MLLMPMRGAAPGDVHSDAAERAPSAELRTARNAVFVEFGGSAIMLSVNYDRMLTDYFSLRVGIGGFSVERDTVFSLPILFNFLLGTPSHKLEIGAGFSVLVHGGLSSALIPLAFNVGYRYAPTSTGLSYRIAATPLLALPNTVSTAAAFFPWAGVSFGVQF